MRRICILTLLLVPTFALAQSDKHFLRSGWQIHSACSVKVDGGIVSTTTFRPHEWLPATVPTTVLAAQVAAGLYPDPYYGMNLRNIPGNNSHPVQKMFANLPMPADSPYACPWWYRTEFTVPPAMRGKQVWLHFGGINYRADVWINGKQIANSNDMAGMWREWEFNITEHLAKGTNVLAVEVYAQKENELGITFVDWNPMPPDKDMGLYRPVYLTSSGPVAVRHPFVTAKLDSELKHAELDATVELKNTTTEPITGRARYIVQLNDWTLWAEAHPEEAAKQTALIASQMKGLKKPLDDLGTRQFISADSDNITLAPGETRVINFAALTVDNPKIWWPYGMGAQDQYAAKFTFAEVRQGARRTDRPIPSDEQTIRFAIRSVTSELTPEGHRLFKVNGKNFLVRGGGWTPDLMLRQDPKRLKAELDYARDMHLNTLRLEGKLETDEFFDLADRMGLMIMAGWCCCDHWEHWKDWKPEDYTISAASLADEIRRLRNHPSLLVWLNGSDNPPPEDVERKYVSVLEQYKWPNPYISSATARPTPVTGASGVKMTGPYDWVPPNYWMLDRTKYGGGYGFNTETSPGPAIPVAESVRRMMPPTHWWPIDDVWNYHAGLGNFKNLDNYNAGLAARYGESKSLDDYAIKSQAAAYDGQRAMFEAYIRNRYTSTGVIQWMYNNAWPGLIWHLYDYFLVPGGGYFGTKKANEPVHAIYGYDDRSVTVSNLTQQPVDGLTITARVLNFDLTEKFTRSTPVQLAADSVAKVIDIPQLDDLTPTYFVDLRLTDARGRLVSSNFYWLSTKQDELDWTKSKGFITPESQFADLTQLNSLPKVKLQAALVPPASRQPPEPFVTIKLTNPSKSIAFQVRLRITDGPDGDEIVPVRWDDNYLTLLPGESRLVTAGFDAGALTGKHAVVHVDGWNVEPATIR